jgi:signal peptidase I
MMPDENKPAGPVAVPILGKGPNETQRRRVRAEATALVKKLRKQLKKQGYRVQSDAQQELSAQADAVERAVAAQDHDAICAGMVKLEDMALDRHIGQPRKSVFREYADSIGVAVLVALFLRAFVVEAFKIPSGSMIPTMAVGDHIFVNKFVYGLRIPFTKIKFFEWRKPERGEVIVFMYPKSPDIDYIKRVVAVEGDTVAVRESVLYVNNIPVEHTRMPGLYTYWDYDENTDRWKQESGIRFQEKLNGHEYITIHDPDHETARDFPRGPESCNIEGMGYKDGGCVVPKDTVFVCGDNRDQSNDSRFWGPVPLENIKGKALVVWWSQGGPEGVRWSRMGHLVE